jgi:hypothetical protein
MIRRLTQIFLASVLVLAVSAEGQTDYTKEIEKWRSERETTLKKENVVA